MCCQLCPLCFCHTTEQKLNDQFCKLTKHIHNSFLTCTASYNDQNNVPQMNTISFWYSHCSTSDFLIVMSFIIIMKAECGLTKWQQFYPFNDGLGCFYQGIFHLIQAITREKGHAWMAMIWRRLWGSSLSFFLLLSYSYLATWVVRRSCDKWENLEFSLRWRNSMTLQTGWSDLPSHCSCVSSKGQPPSRQSPRRDGTVWEN